MEHLRTTVRNFDVDTIRVTDSALPYETAVFNRTEGAEPNARVVECYRTWTDAEVGHQRWVNVVETSLTFNLEDIEDKGTNIFSILTRLMSPKEKN
jgi:hypothetical protein